MNINMEKKNYLDPFNGCAYTAAFPPALKENPDKTEINHIANIFSAVFEDITDTPLMFNLFNIVAEYMNDYGSILYFGNLYTLEKRAVGINRIGTGYTVFYKDYIKNYLNISMNNFVTFENYKTNNLFFPTYNYLTRRLYYKDIQKSEVHDIFLGNDLKTVIPTPKGGWSFPNPPF